MSMTIEHVHGMCDKLLTQGTDNFNQNKFLQSARCFSKAEVLAELSDDENKLDLAKRELARAYYKLGKFDDAYNLFEELQATTKDYITRRYSQSQKAIILSSRGDYRNALKIYKSLLEEEEIHQLHVNIGLVYYHLVKYDNENFLQLGLKHIEKSFDFAKNDLEKWQSYHNLGLMQLLDNNFSEAHSNLLQAINFADEECSAITYNTLGQLELERGNLDSADEYLDKALEIFSRISNDIGIGRNWEWRGLILKKRGDYFNCYKALKKAEEILHEMTLWKEVFSVAWHLYEVQKELDPEKAMEYQAEMRYYQKKIEEVNGAI